MAEPASPALPWATRAPDGQAADDAGAGIRLDVGARVEILWQLDDENGAEPRLKWWPATVDNVGTRRLEGVEGPLHTLRYDASSEDGFEETELAFVCFPSEHEVLSLGSCDRELADLDLAPEHLYWRLEGQAWEPPEEEEEEGATDDGGGTGDAGGPSPEPAPGPDRVVRLRDIAEAIAERERLSGSTVDDECATALAALPAEQQRGVAVGFREFTDALVQGIGELSRARGADYVITAADVERVNADIRRRMAEGKAAC